MHLFVFECFGEEMSRSSKNIGHFVTGKEPKHLCQISKS